MSLIDVPRLGTCRFWIIEANSIGVRNSAMTKSRLMMIKFLATENLQAEPIAPSPVSTAIVPINSRKSARVRIAQSYWPDRGYSMQLWNKRCPVKSHRRKWKRSKCTVRPTRIASSSQWCSSLKFLLKQIEIAEGIAVRPLSDRLGPRECGRLDIWRRWRK